MFAGGVIILSSKIIALITEVLLLNLMQFTPKKGSIAYALPAYVPVIGFCDWKLGTNGLEDI